MGITVILTDPGAARWPDPDGSTTLSGSDQRTGEGPVRTEPMEQPDSPAFHAVVTTGIYCRDGCPASPLARNVRDYTFAASAEADGYRPCRRCRPERSPQPVGATDAPDLVCRALRVIAAGGLDRTSTDQLAHDLGVSDRHLRRLFRHHVGTSPDVVARSRRAHLAKRLLDETTLPVSDIAFAAGFNSLRQMNRVVQTVFHRTPTELRAHSPHDPLSAVDGSLVLRLAGRAPFAAEPLFSFLRDRAVPDAESATTTSYQRTVIVGDAPGLIHLEAIPDSPDVSLRALLPSYRSLSHLVEQARRLLDLDAPIQAIDPRLAAAPALRASVRRTPGMRVPGVWDPFELAVRAILGQQVTVAAATTLAGRLVEAHGTAVTTPDDRTHRVWPTAEALCDLDPAAIGVPRARGATLVAISRAVADGELVLDDRQPPDEVDAKLRSLPGIGPWTASYIAMRALGDRDAYPVGDVALRAAMERDGVRPSSAAVDEAFAAWRPWRAYAAIRLWHARGHG